MLSRLRLPTPSPAMVVAMLALLVALGGTSWAVATGSIDSREIKNNTIRGKDVRNGTLTTKDVKNGSLLAGDFKLGQLPAGPRGAKGEIGAQGPPGPPGPPGSDDVQLTTVTGGPVASSGTSTDTAIPLSPVSAATFTQRAGETVVVAAKAEIMRGPITTGCDGVVLVSSEIPPAGSEPPYPDIGLEMVNLWQRGDPGLATDSEVLPAPAQDTPYTLEAAVHNEPPPDAPVNTECGSDTYVASVRVTITHLR